LTGAADRFEGSPTVFSEEFGRNWDTLEVLREIASLQCSAVAEGG